MLTIGLLTDVDKDGTKIAYVMCKQFNKKENSVFDSEIKGAKSLLGIDSMLKISDIETPTVYFTNKIPLTPAQLKSRKAAKSAKLTRKSQRRSKWRLH